MPGLDYAVSLPAVLSMQGTALHIRTREREASTLDRTTDFAVFIFAFHVAVPKATKGSYLMRISWKLSFTLKIFQRKFLWYCMLSSL